MRRSFKNAEIELINLSEDVIVTSTFDNGAGTGNATNDGTSMDGLLGS